jgi:hypothetical protein
MRWSIGFPWHPGSPLATPPARTDGVHWVGIDRGRYAAADARSAPPGYVPAMGNPYGITLDSQLSRADRRRRDGANTRNGLQSTRILILLGAT